MKSINNRFFLKEVFITSYIEIEFVDRNDSNPYKEQLNQTHQFENFHTAVALRRFCGFVSIMLLESQKELFKLLKYMQLYRCLISKLLITSNNRISRNLCDRTKVIEILRKTGAKVTVINYRQFISKPKDKYILEAHK